LLSVSLITGIVYQIVLILAVFIVSADKTAS